MSFRESHFLASVGSPLGLRVGIDVTLAGVATWEREIMLERQREGIAKAKAEGRYKGGPAFARAKSADIIRLAAEGKTREAIARELDVGVASVYRVLATARAA